VGFVLFWFSSFYLFIYLRVWFGFILGYLAFCFLGVWGVSFFFFFFFVFFFFFFFCFCCFFFFFFFWMVFSLCPSLVWNIFCFHCFGLCILGDLSRHVKSAHFLVILIFQVVKLFYFCRCLLFLCFPLVLLFLFFKVAFRLNLAPFLGCLSFILHAFVYFIRTFEPSKTRLDKLFYLLLD